MRSEVELAADSIRHERRRTRWFFAGLLVVNAAFDIVGALLSQHQARSQFLQAFLPIEVSLGGRTGVVLAGLALLFLASGIARGKRIAWQITCLVLLASIALDLVKDLDFEDAALAVWILFGMWWLRQDFTADSDPAGVKRGLAILGSGIALALTYAVAGTLILSDQLSPGFGLDRSLQHLVESMVASPTTYTALTERAHWFLASIPIVSYGLILVGLGQLLRPALAPRVLIAERDRVRTLVETWGQNRLSRLAIHGAASYYWPDGSGCVAFSLHRRTALVLGDPIGPRSSLRQHAEQFIAHCDRHDWIPAFYQVEDSALYRELGFTMVPIGSEAVISTRTFSLEGKERHDLRYAARRCAKAGLSVSFHTGPSAWSALADQLQAVSGQWLQSRGGPELGYSLGTLATLRDPAITIGLATAADGRLEAFVSWLPVPLRRAWTLDLMRRRPDAMYGVMEAMLVSSIEEAASRGIEEISLGLAPRVIRARRGTEQRTINLMKAVYWGLARFQRGRTLHQFKAKFGPRWEDRFLAIPNTAVLPEVLVALAQAHIPNPFRRRDGWGVQTPEGDVGSSALAPTG